MTWANPFALVGLALVALPVLIHMMARARAREVRFPTLRFLEGSRHQPARRTKLQDIPLLVLRAAALMVAALAAAGPMLRTAPVRGSDGTIARAVLLDASASMRRDAAAGAAFVRASAIADSLVRSATSGLVAPTANPGAELAGAAAWALSRPGRAEIVVVSDFQLGSIDRADVAALPAGVGVSFRKVAMRPMPMERRLLQGGAGAVARASFVRGATSVEYAVAPRAVGQIETEILAGARDRAGIGAARTAAAAIGVDAPDSGAIAPPDRPIVIVFAGYESRDSLVAASMPPVEDWQAQVAARVLRDPLLASASVSPPPIGVRSLKRGRGNALLFVSSDAPATEAGVALIAAVSRARSVAAPASEREPATIPDSTLASWTREAAARAPQEAESSGGLPPAARWLWIVALLLLGAEWLLRRSPASAHRMLASNASPDDAA